MHGYTSGSTPVEVNTGTWLCVQPVAPFACPPLTESPFARRRRYLLRGGVAHRLSRRYPAFIAPTGSCAAPHASCGFRAQPLYRRSLQVAASPCWQRVLPDVISAILAWVPGPLPRGAPSVLAPVSSRRTSASREIRDVRRTGLFLHGNFGRVGIFGVAVIPLCSGSHARQAPRLLPPLWACAHRAAGPFTPRNGHAVTRMNCGIATCLNRAIGTAGLSPAGLQPCRPLH